jgi:hypothetical protein
VPIAPSFDSNVYFASFADGNDFGARLLARVEESEKDKFVGQIRDRIADAYRTYFGFDADGVHGVSGITRAGEQGELAAYRVNHARQALQSLANLVVSERVVWQPKATNVDYDSLKQCEVARAVLEFYWTDARVETLVNRAVEEGLAYTEGFVLGLWDETAGEDVVAPKPTPRLDPGVPPADPTANDYGADLLAGDPDDENAEPAPAKSGEFRFENVSTWDVIRDNHKRSWEALDWVVVRVYRNKFSLAAQYPDCAQDIFDAPAETPGKNAKGLSAREEDDVPLLLFFHKRTPAMPEGRESWVLTSGKVVRDGALTYDDIPLFRIVPAELHGTPYGYSQFLEVLGIQELIDSLHSTAATNLTTFATQNLFLPFGCEVQPEQLAGGVRVIQGTADGKEPKALQLCATPPELYEHLERLRGELEMILGVNALSRGQVQDKDLSGSAMLLLDTKVKQQASSLHGSYRVVVQKLGDFVVAELRKRAKTPRTINIVGKENAYLLTEEPFTGESFGHIKRVLVDIGNPLSQNIFGRAEEAKELLKMGFLQNVEQYFMLRDTGRVEPLTQGLTTELLLIKSENEQIAEGEVPEVMLHDNHLLHGREHRGPVASPQARRDPKVLKAQTEHMHKHYEAYYGVAPMQPQVDPMGMPVAGPDGQPALVPEPMYRIRMLVLMGMQPPDPALGGIPGQGGMPGGPDMGGAGGLPPPQDPRQNTPAAPGDEPDAIPSAPKPAKPPKPPPGPPGTPPAQA